MPDLVISDKQNEKYKFTAKVLSGVELEHWALGRFVIDLETLSYHKPRVTVDYNHNEEKVMGFGENFRIEKEGENAALFADGTLIADPFVERITELAKEGTPFEISPTITEQDGTFECVPMNKTVTVNGREVTGPVTIFRNVPIRGFAVCPFGTDKYTQFTLLKARTMPKANVTNLNEPTGDPTPPKDELLQKYIDRFGAVKGVEIYQKGVDYDELDKAWTLIESLGFEVKSPNEPEPTPDPAPTPAPEDPATTALKALITDLKGEFTALKAAIPRGTEPVSGSAATNPPATPKSFEEKTVAAYNKQNK